MKAVDSEKRLIGENIYLRPISEADTDLVLSWRNQKNVVENFIYRKPISKEEHLNWLKNRIDTGLVHQFIICKNENDKPIGSIYLQNFDEESRQAEEGIFIGETDIQGKGIGAEAAILMINYAFEELKLHKLKARVLGYNIASRKMHEKAGYIQEACFKDELYLDGRYEDLIFFGIINQR